MTATEAMAARFTLAALSAPQEQGVLAGLDAVLGDIQRELEGMALSPADRDFLARVAGKATTAAEEADLAFRCCTALIISKLSGEVPQ